MNDDIRRGEEAHRVLSNNLYKEAFEQIEQKLIAQLAVLEIQPERAEYIRQLLVANRTVKKYLEQVVLTGKYAEQEEHRKSLLDKAREKLRAVI